MGDQGNVWAWDEGKVDCRSEWKCKRVNGVGYRERVESEGVGLRVYIRGIRESG